MKNTKEKLTLTVAEMAEELAIGRTTAYQLIHVEGFPVVRVGTRVRIPRREFIEWLGRNAGNEVEVE